MENNPLFWHPPGEYLCRDNPGPLRAPFPLWIDLFGNIPAKNSTLLHIFFKYAISLESRLNWAISFEL
jgi:hypothetical protein